VALDSTAEAERLRRVALASAVAGLGLADAVLAAFVFTRRNPPAEPGSGPGLAELFPDEDRAALGAAAASAQALVQAAPGYGSRLLRRETAAPELVAEMGRDHPGFSPQSYSDVLFLGVQLAG